MFVLVPKASGLNYHTPIAFVKCFGKDTVDDDSFKTGAAGPNHGENKKRDNERGVVNKATILDAGREKK